MNAVKTQQKTIWECIHCEATQNPYFAGIAGEPFRGWPQGEPFWYYANRLGEDEQLKRGVGNYNLTCNYNIMRWLGIEKEARV